MTIVTTDIDIDFADRSKALTGLRHTPACRVSDGGVDRHQTGIYLQDVPTDPVTGWCSIDYRETDALGYFKVDFLNVSLYEGVRDEAHLLDLLHREPDWSLLEIPSVVEQLAHIRGHFGAVQSVRPKSIEDLAVVLAIIRPGARHLMRASRQTIDAQIWSLPPDENGYTFKKAHAVAYAASIVVQLNLLCERIAAEIDGETGE